MRTRILLLALAALASIGATQAQTVTIQPAGPAIAIQPIPICINPVDLVRDQSPLDDFLDASTVPGLGRLYPLTTRLNVTPAGNVGIGINNPVHQLEVGGSVASLEGGIKFPDGTTMITAQNPGPDGPQGADGPAGNQGPFGAPGVPNVNGLSQSNLDLVGLGAATVSTSGNTITLGTSVTTCLYNSKSYTSGARCYQEGNEIPCGIGQGFVGSFMTCQPDGTWQKGNILTCVNPWPNPFCGE